ncbi:MAG: hypothetical protein ACD_56C00083G0001 [uncultured bacterium]|nr:MAG: hypothetical protein ACD_56C00083G0001 [uncultured bacterium]
MEIFQLVKNLILELKINTTKLYLVVANVILVIFAIWFSNVGLLPFYTVSDFVFFFLLAMVLGLYRPGWTFAFFVGTLALENINLAPASIGLSLRPYQFFGIITIISLAIQFSTKRLAFPFPKWRWYDALPLIFALAGMLSSIGSLNGAVSFKQSIVAASFVALYFLTRIYVQSFEDLKRVAPFFLSSSLVVIFYGIWQNIRFLAGRVSYEIMPGRPNGTFTEPDWFGVYLVFLLAAVLAIIYAVSKKSSQHVREFPMTGDRLLMTKVCIKQAALYFGLFLIFISLTLTVSRSAWVGAAFVIVGFLKMILTNGSIKFSEWKWKKFARHSSYVVISIAISLLVSLQLTNFQIFDRVQSTGGLQKVTVSCEQGTLLKTESVIGSIGELTQYGCKFINLEEIEIEKAADFEVFEIKRPDPTVGIRAQIYEKSIGQIKSNPIFGIGWGSISDILGKDESGAGLNASNIFLEVWLGSGIVGFLSLVVLLSYILIKSSIQYLSNGIKDKTPVAFVALGLFAIIIPNLFNSGIFLGFVWTYLGISVSLLAGNVEDKKILKDEMSSH